MISFLRISSRHPIFHKNTIEKFYRHGGRNDILYSTRVKPHNVVKHRYFHTSQNKNAPPLIAMLIKTGGIKLAKGLSIVFGRSFRKLYERLPETVRNQVGKHKVIFSVGGVLVPFVGYYTYTHYEICPITGRKRWITFTKEQVKALSDLDYAQIMKENEGKFLGPSHHLYKKHIDIVSALIYANLDIDTVKNIEWTLHVIDDPTVTNAFVLPNGHIFVFTGMLKMLNSWQEMAVILGHEMSHAILGHSQVIFLWLNHHATLRIPIYQQEQQSYLAFGEVLTVPLLAFIWFFFDDFAAFLAYTIQSYVYPLVFEYGFSLPYSRQLESEADEIGLKLSSKACFDPRWSVLLWEKMAFQQIINDDMDSDEFEYLSTHPGNQKRSTSLEKLLPEMMEIRKQCSCPDLPKDIDPQAAAQNMRRCVANIRKRKELLAALQEETLLLENMSDTSSENTNPSNIDKKSLQKSKDKVANIQHQLTELETEYLLLIGTPKSAPAEIIDKEKGGFFEHMWEKISGGVAVSGKLHDTLYEDEKICQPHTAMQSTIVQTNKP